MLYVISWRRSSRVQSLAQEYEGVSFVCEVRGSHAFSLSPNHYIFLNYLAVTDAGGGGGGGNLGIHPSKILGKKEN
jgi:hypothetical protein